MSAQQDLRSPNADLARSLEALRGDFPTIRDEEIYLDSVASSLTPRPVVEAMNEYYYSYRANVHRGSYDLSMRASTEFESALTEIGAFIGADPAEIILTTNATQAINTVAQILEFEPGDEIIISTLEHTSNMAPWINLQDKGRVRWYNPGHSGVFDIDAFSEMLTPKTKLVAVTYVSNVLGTIVPVQDVGKLCRDRGVLYLIDAAQGVPHLPINVHDIGCDFLAFSGHKMLGPTGIGVLYMRLDHAQSMVPAILGGGTMDTTTCTCPSLDECDLYSCSWSELPYKWHAGTPPIAEAIGLAAAVRYLNNVGLDRIQAHDQLLMTRALDGLTDIPGLTLYGPDDPLLRTSILSFNLEGVPSDQVGRILNDDYRIAVRTGHHCAVTFFLENDPQGFAAGNVRASFYLYNTEREVDRFLGALRSTAATLAG
jgi:cysteine desulfurase/selenocysteine lyase